LNASYTWSKSEGNAEGPVTSDFNFADAGRTEAFDTPWVNYGADGYLPNDRRHQVKLRGAYGLTDNWEFGASLTAMSGRPMSALGVGNPFDGEVFQSFFVCTANCSAPIGQRTYEFMGRGGEGRTPWTYDLGLNAVYKQSFSVTDLRVKLSVFNVLNQERVVQVNERLQSSVGSINNQYGVGTGYQSPRYAMLTLNLDF
jgi:hypothetical protein